MTNLKRQPNGRAPIGLCAILAQQGDVPVVNIRKLCQFLNQAQNLYEFCEISPIVFGPGRVDDHLPVGYTDDTLYPKLRNTLDAHTSVKALIGITHFALQGNCFNRQDSTICVGVVTIYELKRFLPLTKNPTQYLAYLLMCASLIIDTGHTEHQASHGCLFDRCGHKEEFTESLLKPHICNNCLSALGDLGLDRADVQLQVFMDLIRKPDIPRGSRLIWTDNDFKIVLGAFIGVIVHKLASLSGSDFAWSLVGVIGLTLLIFCIKWICIERNAR